MSEEERIHLEDVISAKLKPFYWIIGLYISATLMMAGYQFDQMLILSTNNQSKITSDEAYRNFLEKRTYHMLQKDARAVDIEADKNQSLAPYLINQLNNREAEELDLVYKLRGNETP